MDEHPPWPKGKWDARNREARDFWPEYVYASRSLYGQDCGESDQMCLAINERFRLIDKAIAKAVEMGCILMRYRSGGEKHPEITILTFSDGKGKKFQHSIKMDHRFAPAGRELDFLDCWWFRGAIASLILQEGKVKPDPKGGYIPDAIIDNADRLRSEIVADKKTGEMRLNVTVDREQT